MTDATFSAFAITVDADDLEVIIYRNPADPYIPPQEQDEVARSAPQAEGYDPDAVLTVLGYRRVGEWTLTDWGAVCDVEATDA